MCLAPFVAAADAVPSCTKPAALALVDSTVSIVREFPTERGTRLVSGSAWGFAPQTLATVGHVARDLRLSESDWQPLTIARSEEEHGEAKAVLLTEARIIKQNTEAAEEAAVLIELRDPLPEGMLLPERRFRPLARDEAVMAVGYPTMTLRAAVGAFTLPEPSPEAQSRSGDPSALLRFVLVDPDDRDTRALGPGASGAPIVDCAGRVVAVISGVVDRGPELSEGFRQMARLLDGNGFASAEGLEPMLQQLEAMQHVVYGLPISYFEN